VNFSELLKADEKALIRILLVGVVMLLAIAPGATVLLLEGKTDLLSTNIVTLVLLCAVISIPFHFIGAVTYLHPYQTLIELSKHNKNTLIWSLIMGVGLWSTLSAVAAFAFVHAFNEWLSLNISNNLKVQYIAVCAVIFAPFFALFWVNTSRLIRNIGNES